MSETLIVWAENYFKHKDMFDKKLEKVNQEKDFLKLKYKDREDGALVSAVLEKDIFNKIKEIKGCKKIFIVCSFANTNIDFLIKNWKKFLIQNLIIIFVNIKTNHKVLLNPFIHNKICDQENLENAIRTLFVEK